MSARWLPTCLPCELWQRRAVLAARDKGGGCLKWRDAFSTATPHSQYASNKWSFSASPIPTTTCRGKPSLLKATTSPVALLIPGGRAMAAPDWRSADPGSDRKPRACDAGLASSSCIWSAET